MRVSCLHRWHGMFTQYYNSLSYRMKAWWDSKTLEKTVRHCSYGHKCHSICDDVLFSASEMMVESLRQNMVTHLYIKVRQKRPPKYWTFYVIFLTFKSALQREVKYNNNICIPKHCFTNVFFPWFCGIGGLSEMTLQVGKWQNGSRRRQVSVKHSHKINSLPLYLPTQGAKYVSLYTTYF